MPDAAFWLSLVAMCGTVANLIVGRLKERDKLAHDKESIEIKLAFDKELLEVKHKQTTCEKENLWFREQIAELKQRDAKDRAELQSEIVAIKEALLK